MTDFYTVLQSALSRVGAVDAEARDRIYGHVREVTIQKLRDLNPPLDEQEVAKRLRTFDSAIERIEGEVVQNQAAVEPSANVDQIDGPGPSGHVDPDLARSPNYFAQDDAYETAEREWDDEAASEAYAQPEATRPATPPPGDDTAADAAWEEPGERWSSWGEYDRAEPEPERTDLDETDGLQSPGANGHDRGAGADWVAPADRFGDARLSDDVPANGAARADNDWVASGEPQPAYTEPAPAPDSQSGGWSAKLRPSRLFSRSAPENGAAADSDESSTSRRRRDRDASTSRRSRAQTDRGDPIAAMAKGLRGRRGQRAEPSLDQPVGDEQSYPVPPEEAEPLADGFVEPRRKSRRARRAEARADAEHADRQRPPSRRRRIWILAILVFGAVVVGWAASVFVPILFPEGPAEETAEATPELPPAPVAAVGDAPTRVVEPAAIDGPIILFQGADPTVFEAGPENPVQYQGDAEGGLARITSSISSGGARAVIGLGVAEAIAGRVIRVVIEARGTPGQAAATVNLGYHRGLVELQTRSANLSADFGAIGATWAIPEEATNGDFLLIDPGVPGDGTAIDIRSIQIEIVN